jgi:hypothetical protein
MSDVSDLIRELRCAADRIERSHEILLASLPADVSLRDAWVTALQALPKAYISLRMEVRQLFPDSPIEVSWEWWDGNQHHKGATLELATKALLAAHQPAADPLEAVEKTMKSPVPF